MMVIGIHTSIGLGFGSFSEYLGTIVRQVLNCAVPVFLACSGFFLAKKSLSTSNEISRFYKKQILRVYLPCLIWSVPWLLLHLINGRPLITGVVMFLLCGFTIYYFVLLMIQLYLLLPVIQKVTNKWGGVIAALVLSLMSVVLLNYIRAINGISLPMTVYAAPFPLWIVFFVVGVYLSRVERNYSIGWVSVGVFIALLLQVIEARYLCSFHGVGQGIKPSSFVFSLLMVLLLFSTKFEERYNKRNTCIKNGISNIGEVSFVVYLSHTLVILLAGRIGFYSSAPWLFRWLLIAAIDILVVLVLRGILPAKMNRYLGF